MRVLLIHQSFVSHDHPGGTRHFELLSYLTQRGHACTIVAGNMGYLTGQPVVQTRQWIHESRESGIRILRAYVYPSLHRSFVWRIVAFVSFMVTSTWAALWSGKTDVVMGTSPPLFQLISAWVVSRLKRVPLVIEVRDLWPEFAIDMKVLTNPYLIWIARKLELFLYRRAAHFIVNSPAYEDYLVSKGVPRNKISFISNGVDPEMFQDESTGETFRAGLGLGDKFVATYAGALGLANDIGCILRAAEYLKSIPSIQFVLVGSGKEEEKLRTEVRAKELTNVTFAGCFPKSQMKDVLAGSDVCLATLQDIPMFRTTYPNKVFDYMAAARPTVLAIDGVIRDVIESADGGICVPPGDAQALADAIRRLFDDPTLKKRLGTNARSYVQQHFQRSQHAAILENLLCDLAEPTNSGTKADLSSRGNR